MKKLIPLLFTLIASPSFLFSATCTSQADGDWNDDATWSCGSVPSSNDEVIINHHVTLDVNATISTGGSLSIAEGASLVTATDKNLTISGSGTFSLSGSLNVNKFTVENSASATLNGNVTTSNNVIFKNNATVTGSGNFSVGNNFNVENEANVNLTGTVTAGNDITLKNKCVVSISGAVSATNNLSLENEAEVTFGSGISSGGNMTIKNKVEVSVAGTVSSGAKLNLENEAEVLFSSSVSAIGKVTIKNKVELAVAGSFTAGEEMSIENEVQVTFNGALDVVAGFTVKNQAEVIANSTVSIGTDLAALNTARITFNDDVTVGNDVDTENSAIVNIEEGFDVTGDWTNESENITLNGAANIGGEMINDIPGTIIGSGSMAVVGAVTDPGSGILPSILPIELIEFLVSVQDNTKIKLNWATAAEINNDFFTIERSRNGATWEVIATVKGAGNSSERIDYSAYDENPIAGTAYYRLKQTDYDGKYEYFRMVAVNHEKTEEGGCVFKIYPNPCMGRCNINLEDCDLEESPDIQLTLFDASGQLVHSSMPYRQADGNFSFSIDTQNNLMPGVYVVTGASKSEKYQQKLMVK